MAATSNVRFRAGALALSLGLLAAGPAAPQPSSRESSDRAALEARLAQREKEVAELERKLEALQRARRAAPEAPALVAGELALSPWGLFSRARIGITLEIEASSEGAVEGAVIDEVVPDGPADRAGLRPGDVIVRWNGDELRARRRGFTGDVTYVDHVLDLARRLDPGDEVTLEVLRDGERFDVVVIAEEAPRVAGSLGVVPSPALDAARALESARVVARPRWNLSWAFGGRSLWGEIELIPISAELGEYFGTDRGLLVLENPEGDAFGLQAGDVILSIGDREPRDATHALRILRSYDPGEEVNLHVVRRRERITLSAEVPAPETPAAAAVDAWGRDRSAI